MERKSKISQEDIFVPVDNAEKLETVNAGDESKMKSIKESLNKARKHRSPQNLHS
jgi:hypothetical protein